VHYLYPPSDEQGKWRRERQDKGPGSGLLQVFRREEKVGIWNPLLCLCPCDLTKIFGLVDKIM
jgi:hypothetical protein